jgi:hypothetical protein
MDGGGIGPGTGGSDVGISETPSGSEAGTADAGAPLEAGPPANVKFCHNVSIDGDDVTLTLTVLDKRMPAFTWECSPCEQLPSGQLLEFDLYYDRAGQSLAHFPMVLKAADYVFFGTVVDGEPTLKFGTAIPPATCQSVSPF